jgi:DNA replication and repair protein RecF
LDNNNFFIKVFIENDDLMNYDIQVGFSENKKLVKIGNKAVSSYKDLIEHYNVITLTEDDLNLIKGSPEVRRLFIDQVVLLQNPKFLSLIKEFKKILENRNSLLQMDSFDEESYNIWTKQLWERSRNIQLIRKSFLNEIEKEVNLITKDYFDGIEIKIKYLPKRMNPKEKFEGFEQVLIKLKSDEQRFRRSLFGAHLDDFLITFQRLRSKVYASRGQQKLIVLLIKVAQLKLLQNRSNAVFLLDDFMTDFDESKLDTLVPLLYKLKNQLIFTVPTKEEGLKKKLMNMGSKHIKLTS